MSVEFTPKTLGSGFSTATINENFEAIQTSLVDAVSRSGNIPNQMEGDIDLNSNDLLNVKDLDVQTLSVAGLDLGDAIATAVDAAADAEDSATRSEDSAQRADLAAMSVLDKTVFYKDVAQFKSDIADGSLDGLLDGFIATVGIKKFIRSNGSTAINGMDDWLEYKPVIINITSDHQILNNTTQMNDLIQVWSDLASTDASYTFMLGDLVDEGNVGFNFDWDAYFDVVSNSGIDMSRLAFIGGNHDKSFSGTSVEGGNRMLANFYQRTRKPPVYAVENGNCVFIFVGYHGVGLSQQVTSPMMDYLELLLSQYNLTHNIFLMTHAPHGDGGLYLSTDDNFKLRPVTRMSALLEDFSITAIFSGHNAIDIISADEGVSTTKTANTSTNGNGFVTQHILTGPHIEQKNVAPLFRLGGRLLEINPGASTVDCKMRDHQNGDFIDAKLVQIPLRFKASVGEFKSLGSEVNSFAPLMMDTPKVVLGLTKENDSGGTALDTRYLASDTQVVDASGGDVSSNSEVLHRFGMAGNTDDAEYTSNGNNIGGEFFLGARRLDSDDNNKATGLVAYATEANGDEIKILDTTSEKMVKFVGGRFLVSDDMPSMMVTKNTDKVNFTGVVDDWDSPSFDTWSGDIDGDAEIYGFNETTGLYKAYHKGIYRVSCTHSFSASSPNDTISIMYQRIRDATTSNKSLFEYSLVNSSRQTLSQPTVHIELFKGDTLSINITGENTGAGSDLLKSTLLIEMYRV